MANSSGKPVDRSDALLKVTGAARYAAEMPVENLAHAVLVQSRIAKGRIAAMDTAAAEKAPGVLLVMTPFNAPKIPINKVSRMQPGEGYPLLQDTAIHFNGQHIGLVVAESFEQATHAASLIVTRYEAAEPVAGLDQALDKTYVPQHFRGGARSPDSNRGNPEDVFRSAPVRLDITYTTPVEHHNPMEPHAVIALWQNDGTLVLHHSTQAISGSRQSVADLLGVPVEKVRTLSRFVGGGFGTKGSTWPHVTLAAMASRAVGRPVKLVLTRRQMFSSNGYRSKTVQRLRIGASRGGYLTAMMHDSIVQTAPFGEFDEPCGLPTEMMYACPNVAVTHRVAPINQGMPTFMRAPGEATGMFALESAMDELAYAVNIDPLALRIRNHAERDEHDDLAWSSKSLLQCYREGAQAFGWERRKMEPGSLKRLDGSGRLIGWGMASATYPANRSGAGATVRLGADGTVIVRSGTQDIGTGTYTIMNQVAADALGLDPRQVRAELGDSDLPTAPISGGSQTAASVLPAVDKAARSVRKQLVALALGLNDGPFAGLRSEDIEMRDSVLFAARDLTRRIGHGEILKRAGRDAIEATESAAPGDERKEYSMHAFGGHFAEVEVDPALGEVRVTRYVGAFAAGHIVNLKTARSQMIGGIVYGLGMALLEETEIDARTARIVNADIAAYLVPVNADVPMIDIHLIDESDAYVNPLGVKGIGELPMVGAAAAVANAVFHATAKRIRDLPIRPEKLLAQV